MKRLKEIDKFYWIFAALLLLLSALVIFVVRTMFSALTVSNQIDEEVLQKSIPHLNDDTLDAAHRSAFEQKIPSLDLRQ
jgi:hypothetical protein